ncbi:MAG TPA: tRNA (adenosine(37)-N6)-threonylcarbamoyltransferase complex ATPase subunit type 1 TsaE [Opitutaceae bacterium]
MATSISDRLRAGARTASAGETQALAAAWCAELAPDCTVALHGDLGAGKTTFVQGLALGLGVAGPVTSPTFNIYALHPGSARMLAHLDAYRLGSASEAEDLLLHEFLESPWCLAVEWPENVEGWLAEDALHLDLSIEADGRRLVRLR